MTAKLSEDALEEFEDVVFRLRMILKDLEDPERQTATAQVIETAISNIAILYDSRVLACKDCGRLEVEPILAHDLCLDCQYTAMQHGDSTDINPVIGRGYFLGAALKKLCVACADGRGMLDDPPRVFARCYSSRSFLIDPSFHCAACDRAIGTYPW